MKAWYPNGMLRNRVGIITDVYPLGYVELKDKDDNSYHILHIDKIIIVPDEKEFENQCIGKFYK